MRRAALSLLLIAGGLLLGVFLAPALRSVIVQALNMAVCAPGWFEAVETLFPTNDGEGHGPDMGGAEWFGVLDRRYGLQNDPDAPIALRCAQVQEAIAARAGEWLFPWQR